MGARSVSARQNVWPSADPFSDILPADPSTCTPQKKFSQTRPPRTTHRTPNPVAEAFVPKPKQRPRAKRRQGGDEQEGYQRQEASQQQHDPRHNADGIDVALATPPDPSRGIVDPVLGATGRTPPPRGVPGDGRRPRVDASVRRDAARISVRPHHRHNVAVRRRRRPLRRRRRRRSQTRRASTAVEAPVLHVVRDAVEDVVRRRDRIGRRQIPRIQVVVPLPCAAIVLRRFPPVDALRRPRREDRRRRAGVVQARAAHRPRRRRRGGRFRPPRPGTRRRTDARPEDGDTGDTHGVQGTDGARGAGREEEGGGNRRRGTPSTAAGARRGGRTPGRGSRPPDRSHSRPPRGAARPSPISSP